MATPKFSVGDILTQKYNGTGKPSYKIVGITDTQYITEQYSSAGVLNGFIFKWNFNIMESYQVLYNPTPDPCAGITCSNTCDGTSLYSQKCSDGHCVKDALIKSNAPECGYVPPCPMPSVSMSLVSKDGMTVTVKPSASPGAGASWKSGNPYIIWYDGPNVVVASGNEYTHTYSREGHFTIVLVAENTCGKGVTKSIYVTATKPPATHNPPVTSISLMSKAGLTVVVNAQASPGAGEAWASGNPRISWGDSAASTYHQFSSGNLSHTFAAGATYHIRIVATNAYGLTTTAVVSVTVTAPPPVCHEGAVRSPETCWNGHVIHKEVCRGNRWVPTGQTCLDPAPTIRRLQGKVRALEVQVADLRMKIADLKTRYGI